MRNPKFQCIVPNYKRHVFEITLKEGKKTKHYSLPFAAFRGKKIDSKNPVTSIEIDKELNYQGAKLVLKDRTSFDFPSDLVLYYCDPEYDWSPLNQLKRTLRNELTASKLSIRVIADALRTSPSQVLRLFKENRGAKQFEQLLRLAELVGYKVEFHLKKIMQHHS